eukprot:gene725-807_t
MLFGEDIVFDPFDSNIYENSGAMHMGNMNRRDGDPTTDIDGDKVVINNHDFSDVTEAVRKSQAKDAAVLLKQLYNTSPVKGSTDDWTQVVRVDRVDWSAFFRMEEEMNRHEEVEFVDTSEMDFLETMARARARKMSSIILPRSRGTADGVVASLPIDVASGNVFGYEGHKIVPLPFGKVITSAIEPETYQFYQLELVDSSALLTIEMKVLRGSTDLYLARNHLATATEYDYKVLGSPYSKAGVLAGTIAKGRRDSNSGGGKFQPRISRLVVQPDEDKNVRSRAECTLILGVHGADYGAQFHLWALSSSSDVITMNPSGKQSAVDSLRAIANSDIEKYLEDYFHKHTETEPPDESEEGRESEESSVASVGQERGTSPAVNTSPLPTASKGVNDGVHDTIGKLLASDSGGDENDSRPVSKLETRSVMSDEALALERLVRRAGRSLIRQDRETEVDVVTDQDIDDRYNEEEVLNKGTRRRNRIDPNAHADLFLEPLLETYPSPEPTPRNRSNSMLCVARTPKGLVLKPAEDALDFTATRGDLTFNDQTALDPSTLKAAAREYSEKSSRVKDMVEASDFSVAMWLNKPGWTNMSPQRRSVPYGAQTDRKKSRSEAMGSSRLYSTHESLPVLHPPQKSLAYTDITLRKSAPKERGLKESHTLPNLTAATAKIRKR